MDADRRYRACPLCEAICGLELRFAEGKLQAIHGDPQDNFSRGHICPKGNAILDLEADPDRLRFPMRRTASGWQRMDWDEAFAYAGERLASIQKVHGSNAIAAYLGNPNVHHFGHLSYAANVLRALKTRNVYSASSVDQWPHQLVAWAMFGHQFLIPIVDIDQTDFLLMLGANPVASNGSLLTAPGIAKRLKALTGRGRLVVVDPRRTETAEIASQHLAIRPGTDAWLLVALLRELPGLGEPRLQAYGNQLADFEQAMAAVQALEMPDLQTCTGITPEQVRELAAALYQAPRAAVYGRMGVSTQAFGSLCQWLIQLLNLYTGNLDRSGGVLPNDPVFPVTGPGTSAGNRDRWRSRVRGLIEFAGELPVAALAEEILTPGDGQVRALITSAGNPVLSTPNGRKLDEALAGLDFMVSVDIYRNESTRHAHLILPPTSFLSQHHFDVIFNSFAVRRVARWNRPILPQAADERADWQIFNGIGAAFCNSAGKAWQDLPSPEVLIAEGIRRGGKLDPDVLKAAEHGLDLGPLEPSLLRRLQTASGKIECAPAFLMADLARLASATATPVEVSRRDSLQLIGKRDVRSNNSWMHNAARLVKGKSRHALCVHPDDLRARGIACGSHVRVRTATAALVTEVRADESLRPGVACLPHGFGHQREGVELTLARTVPGISYNDLTDTEALDVPSGNAALNGIEIWLEATVAPSDP